MNVGESGCEVVKVGLVSNGNWVSVGTELGRNFDRNWMEIGV